MALTSPTTAALSYYYQLTHHTLPPLPTMSIANPLHPRRLGSIPSAITGEILQTLGGRYLFDTATADAFVRGARISEKGGADSLLRVRVIRGRQVFVMRKRFRRWRGSAAGGGKGGREAVPIHVEYALYRAPLLAAILLSGPVRKGDTLDVPVPHPEAWVQVVEWIYTGKGADVREVRENVEYLGGRI